MKELLNKELKLVLHPTNILFIPLAFMLFIPNYPYLVIMFYTCLGIFFMCQFGRENNDVFFTMMLPVEKTKNSARPHNFCEPARAARNSGLRADSNPAR